MRFAKSLDNEDYAAAKSLLSDACEYACRGELYHGPRAIIASYEGNGNAANTFDSIHYESQVVAEPTGKFRIHFSDHITHGGQHFLFRCEQLIEIDDLGRIARIEHVDLPGQVEALSEFKTLLRNQEPNLG